MLLKSARLLIYTPSNEHFGIVPLEAMLAGVPVLACNTGGPLETVVEGETGWLRSPDEPEAWTEVMNKVLHRMSDIEVKKMGQAGKRRVQQEFSDIKMSERLDEIVDDMRDVERRSTSGIAFFFAGIGIVLLDLLYSFAVLASNDLRLKTRKKLPPFALSMLGVFCAIVYVVVGRAGTRGWMPEPRPKEVKKMT